MNLETLKEAVKDAEISRRIAMDAVNAARVACRKAEKALPTFTAHADAVRAMAETALVVRTAKAERDAEDVVNKARKALLDVMLRVC